MDTIAHFRSRRFGEFYHEPEDEYTDTDLGKVPVLKIKTIQLR